jgi:hypothetical protein
VKYIFVRSFNQVLFCLLQLGLCFALAGMSSAQNHFYVNSATGSDANDGSQSRPWKTIQHADSALTLGTGGTVVHVAPGTYSGPITTSKSGTPSARIVWLSDTKWGAKITTMKWAVKASYVDINGFDGTAPGDWGSAIEVYAGDSVHVLNNYLHDFATNSCEPYGVIMNGQKGASRDDWFIGNVIRHVGNYMGSINRKYCSSLHAMYLDGTRVVVQNNLVSGVTGWALQRITLPGQGGPDVISNNVFFNNGGGIVISENNGVQGPPWDYATVSNNIIINNGVGIPAGASYGPFGINYWHVTGRHNLVTNNMIYGNLPGDLAHHGAPCSGNTPITGTDGNGNAGGCPNANSKTDASTKITFVNFQNDTNVTPASHFSPDNYQIKAGSNAIQNGTASCASAPGLAPCIAPIDLVGIRRLGSSLDIGAYEQGSSANITAPSGLTATVE